MADIPVAAPATRKQQWLQGMPETQRFMELCRRNNWKSLPGSRSQEERDSGLKAFLESPRSKSARSVSADCVEYVACVASVVPLAPAIGIETGGGCCDQFP
jgi:hypothetical protein